MRLALLLIFLLFRTHTFAAESSMPEQVDGCVVLLHGLARTSASMHVMQKALTESGYRVINIEYPSRELPIEELAPLAVGEGIDECRASGYEVGVNFVTHSLGGILVRYYFDTNASNVVGRVVMLAPPNQGSNAADALRDIPGFDWLNGPAGSQLGKGESSVPLRLGTPDFEFAVVAGNRSIDPVSSAVLENPDDGKVSVADTKLDGMRDFRIMPVSHTYIMKDDDVIELVRSFLRTGQF
jgi:triacylglycerol lipase